MILGTTKRRVLLNAGHWDDPHTAHIDDTGATRGHITEQIECAKIRDALVPILQASGFEVLSVPDELDLKKSIAWVNERAGNINDGLAVDIHLNASGDANARGAEAYHGTSDTTKQVATVLSGAVAKGMGIPDRGAKPDTQTAVGSLGWIRNTKCWAVLVEVCFMTNEADTATLRADGGYKRAAQAIAQGVCEAFGIEPKQPIELGDKQDWKVRVQLQGIKRAVDEIERILG